MFAGYSEPAKACAESGPEGVRSTKLRHIKLGLVDACGSATMPAGTGRCIGARTRK